MNWNSEIDQGWKQTSHGHHIRELMGASNNHKIRFVFSRIFYVYYVVLWLLTSTATTHGLINLLWSLMIVVTWSLFNCSTKTCHVIRLVSFKCFRNCLPVTHWSKHLEMLDALTKSLRTVKAKRRRSKAVTEKARPRVSQKFFKLPPGKVLNSLLLTLAQNY